MHIHIHTRRGRFYWFLQFRQHEIGNKFLEQLRLLPFLRILMAPVKPPAHSFVANACRQLKAG